MKKFGKTIKLFLIDGEPNGRMTCELSNWTGKAYKIPRIKIKDCTDRPDLTNPGIYLLFGRDESGKELIYIGEAESVYKRLNQHLNQKEFWNEAITFISKDENLNKAHIKYLENRLYEIATKVKRYQIENSTIPTKSSIAESDRSEMEEFIENIRMLVNTLGHKVFDEKREVTTSKSKNIFKIKANRGADGQGEPSVDGFVVYKDSLAAGIPVKSMPETFVNLRNKLIDQKVIVKYEKSYKFSDDYIFSSPSSAASIVLGRSANGLAEWKLNNGKTLKEFETENNKE